MPTRDARETLVAFLNQAAARVRALEAQASEALHQRKDQAAYTELLKEKCVALMEFPAQAAALAAAVDPALRAAVEAELASMARRAEQALSIGSIFFMWALLYPDDYKEGEPNDLERFIAEL